MTRYVTLLRFTEQGMKNLDKSTTRAAAFEKAASKAGINVEAQYWTTGSYDGVLIFSAKEETDAMRCLAALAAAANVRSEALRAFTASEFEKIAGHTTG
jgi:uncharacterized protein with GYD domain